VIASASCGQIAEARLPFGRRAHMRDVYQPPYGQQLIGILFPFSEIAPNASNKTILRNLRPS
jgi:hypothetical protein